jgi:hypothetical protein
MPKKFNLFYLNQYRKSIENNKTTLALRSKNTIQSHLDLRPTSNILETIKQNATTFDRSLNSRILSSKEDIALLLPHPSYQSIELGHPHYTNWINFRFSPKVFYLFFLMLLIQEVAAEEECHRYHDYGYRDPCIPYKSHGFNECDHLVLCYMMRDKAVSLDEVLQASPEQRSRISAMSLSANFGLFSLLQKKQVPLHELLHLSSEIFNYFAHFYHEKVIGLSSFIDEGKLSYESAISMIHKGMPYQLRNTIIHSLIEGGRLSIDEATRVDSATMGKLAQYSRHPEGGDGRYGLLIRDAHFGINDFVKYPVELIYHIMNRHYLVEAIANKWLTPNDIRQLHRFTDHPFIYPYDSKTRLLNLIMQKVISVEFAASLNERDAKKLNFCADLIKAGLPVSEVLATSNKEEFEELVARSRHALEYRVPNVFIQNEVNAMNDNGESPQKQSQKVTYTLSAKQALNDGHEFTGQPDTSHYVDISMRFLQNKELLTASSFSHSIFNHDRMSQRQNARLSDDSLRLLFLAKHITNDQLETLTNEQCRVLIGGAERILKGLLTMEAALRLSLSEARKMDLIDHHLHIKKYPTLVAKMNALSPDRVSDEYVRPISDAAYSLFNLHRLIEIGYLSEEDAMTFSSDQARYIVQKMSNKPSYHGRSINEVFHEILQTLPPVAGAYSSCVDFYVLSQPSLLTFEQVEQLKPEETYQLVYLHGEIYFSAKDDPDWQKFVICRCLGWPIPVIDEQNKPSSLRHKLYTQVVNTGYLTDAEAHTLHYTEASSLIAIYEQLRQDELLFSVARPLLSRTHQSFIEKFGPGASGEIRLTLSDIARLSEQDINEIFRHRLFPLEAITARLGYEPKPLEDDRVMTNTPR